MNFVDTYGLIYTQHTIDALVLKIIYAFFKIETKRIFKNYYILVLLIKVTVYHLRMHNVHFTSHNLNLMDITSMYLNNNNIIKKQLI